jgi:CubicO group peptidase (beta-lactamase class C family)
MNTKNAQCLHGVVRAALTLALFVAAASHAAPPRDLDRYAQRVFDTFESPGMVVVIAERGQPTVVRTYGVRRMNEPAKVDEHTLFPIGSTTKAFTSALLATLVDEGKRVIRRTCGRVKCSV